MGVASPRYPGQFRTGNGYNGTETTGRFIFFVPISQVLPTKDRGQQIPSRVPMSNTATDDRAAKFVQLLAAHEHCLSSYVLALVPNWSDAEEIIQQTKLRLWEQFDAYDPDKSFGTWACVIARYEVLTFRKRSARSRVHFSQTFVDRVSEELAQTATESDSRMVFLDECVEKLAQWQRDLLWRCCVVGDSTTTVATQLGRKAESTRKALLRVRRKLFRCIEAAQRKEADQR